MADHEYAYDDWDAPPPPARATPPNKPRGKAGVPLPFERARPVSMIVADATKWYLLVVARLSVFLEGVEGDVQRLERAWFLKSEMRQAAAKALFDPALKREFLEALPLPASGIDRRNDRRQGRDPRDDRAGLEAAVIASSTEVDAGA